MTQPLDPERERKIRRNYASFDSDGTVNVLLAEIDRLRTELAARQAAVLAAVADELEGIDFHPDAKAFCVDLCRQLAGRFRRKAAEVSAGNAAPEPAPVPLAASQPEVAPVEGETDGKVAEGRVGDSGRVRALAILEAANFLRDAHHRDGLTVQEIGTALRHVADEADPMVGSLARDGYGLDEIADMLRNPVAGATAGGVQ